MCVWFDFQGLLQACLSAGDLSVTLFSKRLVVIQFDVVGTFEPRHGDCSQGFYPCMHARARAHARRQGGLSVAGGPVGGESDQVGRFGLKTRRAKGKIEVGT